jgi:hypothetical protein
VAGAGHPRPPARRPRDLISPYDLDARYSIKRGVGWDGYKVQISESCDHELPHLITYVATVPATEPDIDSTARVHRRLAERGPAPAEHLVDAAYVAADQILAAQEEHGIDLVGPLTVGHCWQKKQPGGFDLRSFTVHWDRRIVTCPQGKDSRWWQALQVRSGYAVVKVIFSMKDCTPCPVRAQCTKAKVKARTLTLRPREHHELLADLRRIRGQEAWKARYAHRSGIEATISQAVRAFDLRRCRYRGQAKTAVQHVLIATAINLTRLDAWLCGTPLGPTRASHLAALAPTA